MPSASHNSSSRALAALISGAIAISFAPIFVKMIGMDVMGLTAIAFWRTLIGGFGLGAAALVMRRRLLLPVRVIKFAVFAALFFSLDLTAWHRSIAYAGAGMSTILANTQVFVTAVLSFLFFKEKLTLRFIIAAISAMGGVILLVGAATEQEFSSTYLQGVGFGLATAFVYAGYLMSLKQANRVQEDLDPIVFITWASLLTSVFLGILSLTETASFFPPNAYSWMVVAALGLLVQAAAWMLITRSLRQVDASRAGLVLLLQPTFATLWGWLFYAEELAISQLIGAVITLAAIYVGSVRPNRRT